MDRVKEQHKAWLHGVRQWAGAASLSGTAEGYRVIGMPRRKLKRDSLTQDKDILQSRKAQTMGQRYQVNGRRWEAGFFAVLGSVWMIKWGSVRGRTRYEEG